MKKVSQQLNLLSMNAFAQDWHHPHPESGNIEKGERMPMIVSSFGPIITVGSFGFQFSGGEYITNARAETLWEKEAWSKHIERHRCIVPVTGFYEYHPARKESFLFSLDPWQATLMYLAGLYNEHDHVALITTEANEQVRPVHQRMPVILTKVQSTQWINCNPENNPPTQEQLQGMLVPYEKGLTRQRVAPVKVAA